MNQFVLIFMMCFGAVLTICGIFLYAKKARDGSNKIKFMKIELELSAPSLVIILAGVFLIIFPLTKELDLENAGGGTSHPDPTQTTATMAGGGPSTRPPVNTPPNTGGGPTATETPTQGGHQPPVPAVTHQATANIAGLWVGNTGSIYEITQAGTELFIQEFDPYTGVVTAECAGAIQNNSFALRIVTLAGQATGQFTVSADGESISGTVVDNMSGIAQQIYLERSDGY